MTVCDFDRLPVAYPGELWYSIVARDVRNRGIWHAPKRARALLGGLPKKVNVAFPNRIGSLLHYRSLFQKSSALDFAREHTLLPYYLAFEGPSRLSDVLEMSETRNLPLSRSLGHFTPTWLPTHLRYCRSCNKENRATYGESYWYTAHQLPLVVTCHHHGEALRYSTVAYAPANGEFLTMHMTRCTNVPLSPVPAGLSISMAACVSIMSRRAATGLFAGTHLDSTGYSSMLSSCGYASNNGQIATARLDSAMQRFLSLHGAGLSGSRQRPWWRATYTRVSGRLWPIHHVAMRLFILQELRSSLVTWLQLAKAEAVLLGDAV